MNLSEKMTHLRNHKNITQKQLAQEFKVSRATISSWENGRSLPDLEMIVHICDFFNVTLDYMLRDDEKALKKMSMSKRKKNVLKITIFILFIIILLLSCFAWQSSRSFADPDKVSILKVEKIPVKINKNIHGKYISKDYDYNVYVKMKSLFTTWDNIKEAAMLYGNRKENKTQAFASIEARNSINIIGNIINNNKVRKIRISSFARSFTPQFDKESPYNIGKNIYLFNHDTHNKNNKLVISAKDNK
ncbi:helix-turn-helix domain-containing protein [Apilactobacillus micheneri]|uniref:helix-turn-helix domain-containing protein n=1 Tax=Apilactobacillus micheneri TaxID=1899430 RepID=UPI00112CE1D7|nr:helix-turn-helix transcriptional regulator [Apilactobacillus micheneri]TPR39072.1 XRE family transcriptional regulator [Apilactobacillus micheneri]